MMISDTDHAVVACGGGTAMQDRERLEEGDSVFAHDSGETGFRSKKKEKKKRKHRRSAQVLQLQVVRGSLFFSTNPADDVTAAAAGGTGVVIMEAAVWSRMPEELIWEVVRLVPAATQFRLQLVSRKWRQMLTSAHFWKQHAQQQSGRDVVACVWPVTSRRSASGPTSSSSSSGSGSGSSSDVKEKKILRVDLSFVPSTFWPKWPCRLCKLWLKLSPGSSSYCVVAAAHGLVCISNDRYDCNPRFNDYCVLNPLTRTCVVLPRLPFRPDMWHPPTRSGAVTISRRSHMGDWMLATYHVTPVAAGGGGGTHTGGTWVVAHKPVLPNWAPKRLRVLALLDSETYMYRDHSDRVHVVAAAGEVEVDAPSSVTLPAAGKPDTSYLWLRETRSDVATPRLVAHPDRAAVFFVSDVVRTSPLGPLKACCIWRLVRERMEWEAMPLLDVLELTRITGVSHVVDASFYLRDAYTMGEFVCCHVCNWLIGFNLDTGKWELLRGADEQQPDHEPGLAMELRPHLFLS